MKGANAWHVHHDGTMLWRKRSNLGQNVTWPVAIANSRIWHNRANGQETDSGRERENADCVANAQELKARKVTLGLGHKESPHTGFKVTHFVWSKDHLPFMVRSCPKTCPKTICNSNLFYYWHWRLMLWLEAIVPQLDQTLLMWFG